MYINNSLLFIKDNRSQFDSETKQFDMMFDIVDKVESKEEVLKLFNKNQYDVVLGDLSVEPEKIGLFKQIKDMKKDQIIFVILDHKDTDKLFGIADLGINAFELLPEQFDEALKMLGTFNPKEV